MPWKPTGKVVKAAVGGTWVCCLTDHWAHAQPVCSPRNLNKRKRD